MPAGVIDLPTLQRYMNFHYSVTIDLFGADESSNAATFYNSGLKGRFEETKRQDDHKLHGLSYKVLAVQDGRLVEKEVPMLNALNEVLRDDFIKDSIAGIGRWNKVIEKAGLPLPAARASQGVSPPDRRARGREGQPGRPRGQRRRMGARTSVTGCPRPTTAASWRRSWGGWPRRPSSPTGSRRRRSASTGTPSISSTCALAEVAAPDAAAAPEMHRQHLIDPETCIRCNTCEETCPVNAITHDAPQLRRRSGEVRVLPGLHRALPDRRHRQLAHRSRLRRLTASRSSSVGMRCPARSPLEACVTAPGRPRPRPRLDPAAAPCPPASRRGGRVASGGALVGVATRR